MSDIIHVDIQIDDSAIQKKFENLVDDDKLMLQIQNLLAKKCDPYVPESMGDLAQAHMKQTIDVTPEYVAYIAEYAHYVYTGEVYGPNFLITQEDGTQVWKSPKGKGSKHPMGKGMEYTKPEATKEWDKTMMERKGDEFLEEVKQLIERRAKELYG